MEVTVEFKTITPIYTGDAWQECREIKPASIMGSLRFWFEVLCYFNGVISDGYFDKEGAPKESLDYNDFRKKLYEKINRKLEDNEEYNFEEIIDEILSELGISIPSRIFGCTGWKSKIRIKNVSYEKPKKLEQDNINFEFPLNKLKYPKNQNFG